MTPYYQKKMPESRDTPRDLREWVQHKDDCECVRPRQFHGVVLSEGGRCTCGLREALAALATEREQRQALAEKWRASAGESSSFADADSGQAPPENVSHARGMAEAFKQAAAELDGGSHE